MLADTLRRRRVAAEVLAAFIDDDPPVSTLPGSAAFPHMIVVPFLIGGSYHVEEDIPRLLGAEAFAADAPQEVERRGRDGEAAPAAAVEAEHQGVVPRAQLELGRGVIRVPLPPARMSSRHDTALSRA